LISKFSTKDSKKSNLKPSENMVEEKSKHGLKLEGKYLFRFLGGGKFLELGC
jgi:hypothetical protein